MTKREAVVRLEIMRKLIERLPEIDGIFPNIGGSGYGCSIEILDDNAVSIIENAFHVALKTKPILIVNGSDFHKKASALVDGIEIFTLLR